MADIIFFAVLAGFIFYKLHTVLGRRDDSVPPKSSPLSGLGRGRETTIIDAVPVRKTTEEIIEPAPRVKEPEITNTTLKAGIDAIRAKDAGFTPGKFLSGANMAFEMVMKAFNEKDKETLKMLLDSEVYRQFEQVIQEREKTGNDYVTTLVAITVSDIQAIALDRSSAEITVDFTSEQIRAVKDKDGKVVEGNTSRVEMVKDTWVFRRDVSSRDPNWIIIET